MTRFRLALLTSILLSVISCSGGSDGVNFAQGQNWITVTSTRSSSGNALLSGTAWVSSSWYASHCAGLACLLDTTRTDDYPGVDISVANLSTGMAGQVHSSYGPGTDWIHEWSATVPVQPGPNTIQLSAFDPGGKGGSLTVELIGGPVNVTATPENGQVVIRWDTAPGAISYNVYWATTAANANQQAGTKCAGVTSPFVHTGLINGTAYYYAVTAVFAKGESGESPVVHAVPGTMIIGGAVQGAPLVLTNAVTTFSVAMSFSSPQNITTDGSALYLTDNGGILKIGIDNHAASSLATNNAEGLTTDGVNLYVTNSADSVIQKIVIATGEITTLAGSAGVPGTADGVGPAARFYAPFGITTDGTNLYVADTDNCTIRKIDIATHAVTTLAGSAGSFGLLDGAGSAARFSFPMALTTDGNSLYVADTNNGAIRKIVIATGEVTTLTTAFYQPLGITTDGSNLYITDRDHTIRKVAIPTGTVTIVAGSAGTPGLINAVGQNARFYYPTGITTDGTALFVTDSANRLLRKIQ